jgi:PAS domain S-box-containing protein
MLGALPPSTPEERIMSAPLEVSPALVQELQQLRQRVAELERQRTSDPPPTGFTTHPSLEHYRLLYEDTPSMSFALSPDGTVLSVNRFGADQLGYSAETLTGQSVLIVFDPADHHTVREQLRACTSHPYKIFQWNIKKVRRDGTRLWVRETARAVRDENGTLLVLVICEDITAQKAAEEQSRTTVQALQALIHMSPLAVIALDTTGETVTLWNQVAESMFGWRADEVVGHPAPFLPSDKREESDRLWATLLQEGSLSAVELRRTRRDGSPIDLALWATMLKDPQGNVTGTLGFLADMTERKRTVDALQESEQRSRALYEQAPLGIGILDSITGQFQQINNKYCEITGYSEKEMLARTFQMITHPEDLEADVNNMARLLSGEIDTFRMEKRYIRKDGSTVWVSLTCVPLWLEATDRRLHIAMVENITDRKEAEQELHMVRERLQHLMASSPAVIYSAKVSGDYGATYVSENIFEQLGYEPREFVDDSGFWVDRIHPDDRSAVLANLSRLFREGHHVDEYRFLHKDGTYRWMHDRLKLLRDHAGNPLEIIGSWIDITERKRAEESLQESEARFRQIAETIEEVVWSADPAIGRMLYISPAYERVWGRTCASLYEHPKSFIDAIHPEDRARVLAGLAVQRDGLSFTHEYRIVRPDGVIRWVWDRGFPILDRGTGQLTHYVGVALDITERKLAEEALRLSEEELREAFEERQRLSQDLHDNLLQSLYAVGMGLELTKQRVRRTSHVNAIRLEGSVAQLNEVIREVRSFIPRMHTPMVTTENVAEALRALVGSFVAIGAGDIALTIDPDAAALMAPEQSTHLLAIAREALSNSIRHTKATERTLTIQRIRGSICMKITDNGHGFSISRQQTQGMGLKNMKARARKLGARIAIASAPGKGTHVTVSIPRD